MNGKRRRLLLAAVEPVLEPQERVEVTAVVNLSSVSVRRTAAFAVASAIVSGGGMAVVPSPTPMYLAMTDRRILVFRGNPVFARPEEHLMTIPRAGLVRTDIKERVLNSSFVVSAPDSEQGLKIIFPLLGRKERNRGQRPCTDRPTRGCPEHRIPGTLRPAQPSGAQNHLSGRVEVNGSSRRAFADGAELNGPADAVPRAVGGHHPAACGLVQQEGAGELSLVRVRGEVAEAPVLFLAQKVGGHRPLLDPSA
ncbi:hypothetical protein GCM10010254_05500 [Streptomyces chromofuscus]|nr:hypothetical protein [Streptomyces chromofuscus]GGS88505.1 hypothetical protein GCM10010254_05500 [Streptomyces chromofuscus]